MIIFHPDGRVEERKYEDYKDIVAAVNEPGGDHAFTTVPLPEGPAAGYVMFVNDDGLIINLHENAAAEYIAQYTPLVGPAVLMTFEESGDTELIGDVIPEAKAALEIRLAAVKAKLAELAQMRAAEKAKLFN